jgi:hypothetical protein
MEMFKLLAEDMDLPLSVVAPFKVDHPIIQKLGKEMMERSSVQGTLGMLVNGGEFQDELSGLAAAAGLPLTGFSTNLTPALSHYLFHRSPWADKPVGYLNGERPNPHNLVHVVSLILVTIVSGQLQTR